jgi:hypothetical protein
MKNIRALEEKNIDQCRNRIQYHNSPDNFFCQGSFYNQAQTGKKEAEHERRKQIIQQRIVPVNRRKIVP